MKNLWISFFITKVIYMLLAILVYPKFTSLGDTFRYLSGDIESSVKWLFDSTLMMDTVAGYFGRIFGTVFGNLPFVLLSTYGIYYAVSRIQLNRKKLLLLLLLLSVPNFGIWTSIASKESVSVFFLGIILGFIIDIIKRNEKKNLVLVVFSFYLCLIFKPQYLIGIGLLLFYIYTGQILKFSAIGKSILLIVIIFISYLILFIFRYEIDDISFSMPIHFDPTATSTRENTIWINEFDVYWNAPYGMIIGFIGPTLSEAISRPIHFFAFVETAFIITLFLFAIFQIITNIIRCGKINIFFVSIFSIPFFWILFVHYPFGVLNPGSALRYRQGFYAFFVIFFFFCYLESKKWRNVTQ